jgi:hypothetical protein
MRADEGNVFGYSCPGCGTREQVRDLWQIIACGMFQWASCAVLLGHQTRLPSWGNVRPLSRVSVCLVPGLWRNQAVAFTCGPASPGVQTNNPLVTGA